MLGNNYVIYFLFFFMKKFFSLSIFGLMALPQVVSAQGLNTQREFSSELLSTVVYAFLGLLLCFIVYKIIDMMTPGHLSKQLTEDKNMALAIVIGSLMIGVSIIIAAAIHG